MILSQQLHWLQHSYPKKFPSGCYDTPISLQGMFGNYIRSFEDLEIPRLVSNIQP